MQARFLTGVIITVFVLLAVSCSTRNVGELVDQHGTSAFTLNVLPDSFIDGSSADSFDVSVEDYGRDVLVHVSAAGAKNLKALYFELSYDGDTYRPLTADATEAMGSKLDVIHLNVFTEPGKMVYGQVLTDWQFRPGFTGDATIASVLFRKAPAVATRRVSIPPGDPLSGANLVFNGTDTLTWYYRNTGDYDQNGQVSIGDLTPLGAHWNDAPSDPPGSKYAEPTIQSVIDGNNNGIINIGDLTPIGANFGKLAIGGYNVFTSLNSADYPAAGTKLDNVAFNTATGGVTVRKFFNSPGYVIAAPVADAYYWVKPNDAAGGNGVDGKESNMVGGPPAQVTLTLTNPPASGDGSNGTPYVFDDQMDYIFQVMDLVDGDQTAAATYTLSNPAAGTCVAGTLNVTDGWTEIFSVTANYNGTDAIPVIWFGPGAGSDIDIYPDPADTDWAAATGAGTLADPYVLDSADLTRLYSLLADDQAGGPGGGNPIPVGDLVWDAMPPFIVTWTQDGEFQANQFTSNYVFAASAAPAESNHLEVEIHALP